MKLVFSGEPKPTFDVRTPGRPPAPAQIWICAGRRFARLEKQFQGKLNLARRGGGRGDLAEGRIGDAAAVGRLDEGAGLGREGEVGVVQNVEELRAELEASPFLDGGLLHQRVVEIDDAGAR